MFLQRIVQIRMFEGKVKHNSYILLKFSQANSSYAMKIRRDSLARRRDVDRSLAVVVERDQERDASGTQWIKPSSISNKIDMIYRVKRRKVCLYKKLSDSRILEQL